MAWQTGVRTSPFALIPFGQWTMKGPRAAAIGFALPAAERGIARDGPSPRIVIEGYGPPSSSIICQVLLQDRRVRY